MRTPKDETRQDTRSLRKRSPGKYGLLVLALFVVLAGLFGVPSYLDAAQDGTTEHWWQVAVFLVVGCAVAMVVVVVATFIRVRRRLKAMLANANAGLKKLTKTHPDATLAGSLVPRGLSEALQLLGHEPLVGVRTLAVMTDSADLSLWSIDGRPKRFASFPAASVVGFEYHRPKPRAMYSVLTAIIRGDAGSTELPVVLVPLHPKHSTEAGRATVLDLLTENLRHGITKELPEGLNPYLATEAEVAALRSATVRKPELAIDESGVFDDRAELR
jgi:hypothetical protein